MVCGDIMTMPGCQVPSANAIDVDDNGRIVRVVLAGVRGWSGLHPERRIAFARSTNDERRSRASRLPHVQQNPVAD